MSKPDTDTIHAIQIHEHKRAGAFLRHLVDANPDMHEDAKIIYRHIASSLERGQALNLPFPGFDESTGDYETPKFLRR